MAVECVRNAELKETCRRFGIAACAAATPRTRNRPFRRKSEQGSICWSLHSSQAARSAAPHKSEILVAHIPALAAITGLHAHRLSGHFHVSGAGVPQSMEAVDKDAEKT